MKQPEEQTPRDRMLNAVNGINMLKDMLAPVHNKYRFGMPITVKHVFEEVQNTLRTLRKSLRPEQTPKTWVERIKAKEAANTHSAINYLMAGRSRTRWDVKIGGPAHQTGHAAKNSTHRGSRIDFHLGLSWHRKVYLPLVYGGRLTNDKDIIPLSAVEYRVNVQGVRLYRTTVWDFKKKKEVQGYIGQSTFSEKCVFRLFVTDAVNAAKTLTIQSINEKLGVQNV